MRRHDARSACISAADPFDFPRTGILSMRPPSTLLDRQIEFGEPDAVTVRMALFDAENKLRFVGQTASDGRADPADLDTAAPKDHRRPVRPMRPHHRVIQADEQERIAQELGVETPPEEVEQ